MWSMACDNDITVFVKRCFTPHSMLTIFSTPPSSSIVCVFALRHGHEERQIYESWEFQS